MNSKRAKRRYFAVVRGNMGYALDYYPHEAEAYRREHGTHIVGDFGTIERAQEAVERTLLKRAANGETEPENLKARDRSNFLDAIYEEVEFRLNPGGDDCWHCGGEGYTFDCFDGCCADAEYGCEDCSTPCPECRIYARDVRRAVRVEVLRSMNIQLARAFLRRSDKRSELPANVIWLSLHAGRTMHKEFSAEERADSACWVEGLM